MNGRKKRGRKAWKYLVFWLPERKGEVGHTSVEPSSTIPVAYRKENCACKLKWEGKCYRVKILKVGDDETELLSHVVDGHTGAILSKESRAFSPGVLAVRRKQGENKEAEKAAPIQAQRRHYFGHIMQSSSFPFENLDVVPSAAGKPLAPKKAKTEGQTAHAESLKRGVFPEFQQRGGDPEKEQSVSPPLMVPQPFSLTGTNVAVVREEQESGWPVPSELTALMTEIDVDLSAPSSWDIVRFLEGILLPIQDCQKSSPYKRVACEILTALAERSRFHALEKERQQQLSPQLVRLPPHFFIQSANKVELFPDLPFYVHPGVVSLIDARLAGNNSWQHYVDVVLSEIYKDNLKWVSAEGKRGTVGIHSTVREGLLSKEAMQKVFKITEATTANKKGNNLGRCDEPSPAPVQCTSSIGMSVADKMGCGPSSSSNVPSQTVQISGNPLPHAQSQSIMRADHHTSVTFTRTEAVVNPQQHIVQNCGNTYITDSNSILLNMDDGGLSYYPEPSRDPLPDPSNSHGLLGENAKPESTQLLISCNSSMMNNIQSPVVSHPQVDQNNMELDMNHPLHKLISKTVYDLVKNMLPQNNMQ